MTTLPQAGHKFITYGEDLHHENSRKYLKIVV